MLVRNGNAGDSVGAIGVITMYSILNRNTGLKEYYKGTLSVEDGHCIIYSDDGSIICVFAPGEWEQAKLEGDKTS